MDKYSRKILEKLVNETPITETERLKPFLIEAFFVLPRKIVNHCIQNLILREMDRWGEYCPEYELPVKPVKLGKNIIYISYETLTLDSKIARFIFLHEIGHAENNHSHPMSDWKLRIKQDEEADKFAGQYFPEWKQYFARDENNNLRLTKLGEKHRMRKTD